MSARKKGSKTLNKRKKMLRNIIVAALVVVALIAVWVGFSLWQHNSALQKCKAAVKAYNQQYSAVQEAAKTGQAAAKVKASEISEVTLISDLNRDLEQVPTSKDIESCASSLSTKGLIRATHYITSQGDTLGKLSESINENATGVLQSRNAKQLGATRATFETLVGDAEMLAKNAQLMLSTANQDITKLHGAIDTAKELVDDLADENTAKRVSDKDKKDFETRITQQTKALNTAMQPVKDAVAAEQARQAAAAQKAAAEAAKKKADAEKKKADADQTKKTD